MKVEFRVDGKPVGKERPRTVRSGGYTHTYTPKKTLEYERKVACAYLMASKGTKLHGPISLKARIFMQIPKSYSKKLKKMLEGKPYCKNGGDVDNIVKSIMDGCQGVAYDNDCQIFSLDIKQRQSVDARVEIELEEEGIR